MNNCNKPLRVRPFPWKCGDCRQRAVYPARFAYACEFALDDERYTVSVPDLEAPRCQNCGAIVMIDTANERMDNAFRVKAGLLMPEEIRQRREALELSQEELARRLGVDAAALARWEDGAQFQPRALNNLLELFFSYPNVRAHLGVSSTPHSQPITTSSGG
jgi:putative zinc finger/helix-turn-helix YgiT family protein